MRKGAPSPRTARSAPLRAVLTDAGLVVVSLADMLSKGINSGWEWQTGLAVLAVVAVAVRRRWPFVALLLGIPSMIWSGLQVAPAVLLATFAHRRSSFPVVAVVTLAVALSVAGTALYWYPGPGGAAINLQSAIYYAGFVGSASLLGHLARVRREQQVQLHALQESRDREHQLLVEATRTDERTRLAREMHDVVSHQVSLIAIQAGALRVTGGTAQEVSGVAETIRALAVQTNDELRQVLGALRSDDVAASLDAQHGIGDICQLWRAVDVAGEVQLPSERELATVPAPVQRAVYRITQEGLTNVRKHADGARVQLRVELEAGTRRGVRLTIANSARPWGRVTHPTTSLAGGSGLIGVRERITWLDGTLDTGSTADGGFTLTAWLPLPVTSVPSQAAAPTRDGV